MAIEVPPRESRLSVITGPENAGKTTAALALKNAMEKKQDSKVVYISEVEDYKTDFILLQSICKALNTELKRDTFLQRNELNNYVKDFVGNDDNKILLLILDNAHLMPFQRLEFVKGIFNYTYPCSANSASDWLEPFRIILIGRPELLINIKKNPALESRIGMNYYRFPAAMTNGVSR